MNDNTIDQINIKNVNRLLKAEEVAEHLSVSPAFAYRLIQTGQIPAVRLGRVVRVRPQDLQAYIEANLHRRVDFL